MVVGCPAFYIVSKPLEGGITKYIGNITVAEVKQINTAPGATNTESG